MAPHELPLPAGLLEGATETVRIFRKPDGSLVVLLSQPRESDSPDPGVWGILAVDLMHHAALMLDSIGILSPDGPVSRGEILDRMWALLNAEWQRRTDEARRLTDA